MAAEPFDPRSLPIGTEFTFFGRRRRLVARNPLGWPVFRTIGRDGEPGDARAFHPGTIADLAKIGVRFLVPSAPPPERSARA